MKNEQMAEAWKYVLNVCNTHNGSTATHWPWLSQQFGFMTYVFQYSPQQKRVSADLGCRRTIYQSREATGMDVGTEVRAGLGTKGTMGPGGQQGVAKQKGERAV